MSRRSSVALWVAALVLAVAPYALLLTDAGTYEFSMTTYGGCPGFELNNDLSAYLMPLGAAQPLVVAAGFAVWATLLRRGRRGWSRAVGALVTIAVALPDVVTLSLLAVDRVLDEACAATWEQWLHGWSILWYFHGPLIAAVVVVAVSIRPALSRSSVHG